MELSNKLIKWYKIHKRDLPWRNTKNPYHIWLSEIILQQTRVVQGLSYYQKFVKEFPTVKDLALAEDDKVMNLWKGLGYYTRARNLLYTARYVYNDLNGDFPNTYVTIKKLKGVGEYTAAAIASFAYDEAQAVCDGNVKRVVSRLFSIEKAIDSRDGEKEVKEALLQIFPGEKAALFNQAIMELGALVCAPKSPNCSVCPISVHCRAFEQNSVMSFPVKEKKIKVKERFFHFFFITMDNQCLVQKREGKDIWHSLYQFPLIESKSFNLENDFKEALSEFGVDTKEVVKVENKGNIYKHKLTHQNIVGRFYKVELDKKIKIKGFEWVALVDMHKLALPKLLENYLNDENIVTRK